MAGYALQLLASEIQTSTWFGATRDLLRWESAEPRHHSQQQRFGGRRGLPQMFLGLAAVQ
jgi:hypothetical protein